jgi:hypothetical protein
MGFPLLWVVITFLFVVGPLALWWWHDRRFDWSVFLNFEVRHVFSSSSSVFYIFCIAAKPNPPSPDGRRHPRCPRLGLLFVCARGGAAAVARITILFFHPCSFQSISFLFLFLVCISNLWWSAARKEVVNYDMGSGCRRKERRLSVASGGRGCSVLSGPQTQRHNVIEDEDRPLARSMPPLADAHGKSLPTGDPRRRPEPHLYIQGDNR